MREHKKRRRVRDPETLAYYRSLFKKHLEGKELSEELVDYVVGHENKWLRNVFRHYIQYLFYKRLIDPETYGWLMEVVPSRRYVLDVRPYQISYEELWKTLDHLEKHRDGFSLSNFDPLSSPLYLHNTLGGVAKLASFRVARLYIAVQIPMEIIDSIHN